MKNKVRFTKRSRDGTIVEESRTFPDSSSACTFFREIKGSSYTKPIIETLYGKDVNARREQ